MPLQPPSPLTESELALLDVALKHYALLERGMAHQARSTHARADHHHEATEADRLRLKLRAQQEEEHAHRDR